MPDILGLRWVGPYLTGEDIAFVCEDNHGVCGYVLAAVDSFEFVERFTQKYLPKMRKLYPTNPATEKDGDSSQGANLI